MNRFFSCSHTEDYVLAYWEKNGSVSVLPSGKVTGDTKGFGASCRVRLGKTDGVTSHNDECSTQLEQGRDTEPPCSAALQPVYEWGRSSRPEQCLLLVHQEEPKMVEKTYFGS